MSGSLSSYMISQSFAPNSTLFSNFISCGRHSARIPRCSSEAWTSIVGRYVKETDAGGFG